MLRLLFLEFCLITLFRTINKKLILLFDGGHRKRFKKLTNIHFDITYPYQTKYLTETF